MLSERIPVALRHQVSAQARGLCEYCRCPAHLTNASFHCDHIRPREAGGETTLDNLAWSCPRCNSHKHTKTRARDPQTGRLVPLFNPRRQHWSRHFEWNDDFISISGRTATGRATVEVLHLNRPALTNLRRALYSIGGHPPEEE